MALLALIAVGVGATVLFITSDQSETAVGPQTTGPTAAAGVAEPDPSSSNAGAPSESPSAAAAVADPDNLDCSGRFVVVFNLTNDATELDKSKPWLEAENSCSGIDRKLGGKPLRFNYVGPYDSADDACQQLLSMNPHSDYVKLLRADQSDGRHYLCSCDAAASELPYLSDSGGEYPQSKTEFRAAVDLHLMLKRVQGFKSDNLGLYGQKTTDAVSTYQTSQGLPPTGEVDSGTWSQLLASSIACPS